MSDPKSALERGSKALITLVIAILAVGCSSMAPLPENLDHRSAVKTAEITLNVLQQIEPDDSTALIVDQLQAALPLFAARLPRGLTDDHIDVILLKPAAFEEYLREVLNRDPSNQSHAHEQAFVCNLRSVVRAVWAYDPHVVGGGGWVVGGGAQALRW